MPSDTVVGFGSVVVSSRGLDTVELTEAVTIETTPAVLVRGHGPVETIELGAQPGLARVVRGKVSGIELERQVILRASPMTVRREPAWAGPRRVALTFDDGPWPGQTELFLDALDEAGARGTFFMVGYLARRYPDLARTVADAGMEIGAHSQSHKLLGHASKARIRSEISKGIASVEKVTGKRPVFYRPAGGSVNKFVYKEARRLKVRVVLWTIDPQDWRKPGADVIARRILDRVRPGSVVLMHDGGGDRSQTLEALRIVLRGLAARGYETVTLSELYAKP
jgi:peptidoglycan/xylan/chitin deacetylase (PgdA/CDA1 family)